MEAHAFALSLIVAMSVLSGGGNEAKAVTIYDLGPGTSLGIISPLSTDNGGINDPAPSALVCSASAGTCNTKEGTNRGTYTGTEDINSKNLWKSDQDVLGTEFSITTNTDGKSGTWQQIWQGGLLVHYVAVKASDSYHLIGFDLSGIIGALAVGDTITGDWTTGLINNEMSHVSLYNTAIPLPAALPLMIGGLAGLGYLGSRRRKRA